MIAAGLLASLLACSKSVASGSHDCTETRLDLIDCHRRGELKRKYAFRPYYVAGSPCVANTTPVPAAPPLAAPMAAPSPPPAIAPIAAPIPAPIPTFTRILALGGVSLARAMVRVSDGDVAVADAKRWVRRTEMVATPFTRPPGSELDLHASFDLSAMRRDDLAVDHQGLRESGGEPVTGLRVFGRKRVVKGSNLDRGYPRLW